MEPNTQNRTRRKDAIFASEEEKNDFHNKRNRELKIEKDNRLIFLEKQVALVEYQLSELDKLNTLRASEIELLKKIISEKDAEIVQLKEMLGQVNKNPLATTIQQELPIENVIPVEVVAAPNQILTAAEHLPEEGEAEPSKKIMFGFF